jgi:predicted Zn-dependent peptidase
MRTAVTRQDSRFYTHQLPNGLQMLGQQIPGVQSVATVFWVYTGTRDELPEQLGVSHFLEHMAFRRTKHFAGDQIDRAFEEMGADHNAATGPEMTFYWTRVLSENVFWSLDVLTDLLQPVLDQQDFDQERNVILEEIARYEDLPTQVLLDHFMDDFFGSHPLSGRTLGTPDTIQALTVENMKDYWSRRYGSKNVLFAIAGAFEWDSIVERVEQLSESWGQGETGRRLDRAPFNPVVREYQHRQFVQEQLAIGTPSVSRSDHRYYAAAILATILGDETGSRLYWAIQQRGLAESATAQIMEFDDNGVMLVHLATEPKLAAEALDVTRREMGRLQSFDVTQDELDRAKAKLESSVIIGGESTNERVMGLIRSWLAERRLETLEQIKAKIDTVSLDDLRQLLDAFPVMPGQVTTAVGPLGPNELPAAR